MPQGRDNLTMELWLRLNLIPTGSVIWRIKGKLPLLVCWNQLLGSLTLLVLWYPLWGSLTLLLPMSQLLKWGKCSIAWGLLPKQFL